MSQVAAAYRHPDSATVCVLCHQTVTWSALEPVSAKEGAVWNVCRRCANIERDLFGTRF